MFVLRLIISSVLLLFAVGFSYLAFNIWGTDVYLTTREIPLLAFMPHYWRLGLVAFFAFILAVLILPLGKLFISKPNI